LIDSVRDARHCPSWLRVVEDVRTEIEEYNGYISIPKLAVAEIVY
jgi:hypothetical protein